MATERALRTDWVPSSWKDTGRCHADGHMGWRRRREIRGDKRRREGQSDRISEHIAHYSPLSALSQSEAAFAVLTACGVVGGVCVCPYVCMHSRIFSALAFLVSGRKTERRAVRCCGKQVMNNFLEWCLIGLWKLHDGSPRRRLFSLAAAKGDMKKYGVWCGEKKKVSPPELFLFGVMLFTLCLNDQCPLRACFASSCCKNNRKVDGMRPQSIYAAPPLKKPRPRCKKGQVTTWFEA